MTNYSRTTCRCIVAGAIYIVVICALVIIVPRMVRAPQPDLSLCPFCHK